MVEEKIKKVDSKAGAVPKPIPKQVPLKASRNHWNFMGNFVKEGTLLKVAESQVRRLINTKNWIAT